MTPTLESLQRRAMEAYAETVGEACPPDATWDDYAGEDRNGDLVAGFIDAELSSFFEADNPAVTTRAAVAALWAGVHELRTVAEALDRYLADEQYRESKPHNHTYSARRGCWWCMTCETDTDHCSQVTS